VAFRANRIREWLDLEKLLQDLEIPFQELQKASRPSKQKDKIGIWTREFRQRLADLDQFCARVDHIANTGRERTPDSASFVPSADLTSLDLSELSNTGKNLLDVLSRDPPDFGDATKTWQCFEASLAREKAKRKTIVGNEMHRLCNLTIALRERMGQGRWAPTKAG
jgi:hypothetical protein